MRNSNPSTPTKQSPRENTQQPLLDNAHSTSPIASPVVSSAPNYGTVVTDAAKNALKKDLNTPCVDIFSLAVMSALCLVHPCASLGFAAGVDIFCAIGRTICKTEGPRTVYFADVHNAYGLTREGKDIPALTVLPCGFVGVAAGQFGNLFGRQPVVNKSDETVAPQSPSIQ